MNNWLNSLLPRERAIVTYGSIAVLIVLVWLLALKPLYNNKVTLNKVITQQKETLATMQEQSLEIKKLQQQEVIQPKSSGTQNPQELIDRSLQTWRLKNTLERMQSQGNGVRLTLKNANADRTMRFLHEIESKHSLSISNISIDKNNNKEVGFADFRLTIQSK